MTIKLNDLSINDLIDVIDIINNDHKNNDIKIKQHSTLIDLLSQ